MTAWDIIQGFGAIVGIVTGVFVIWERFFRYQPAMFLVSQALIPGGAQKACYLRVINRSERPIIVSWPTGIARDDLRISAGSTIRDVVAALMDGHKAIVIDGSETAMFPVHTPTNWPELSSDQTVEVVLTWQFVQPLIWKKARSVRISITKQAYLLLQDEEHEG